MEKQILQIDTIDIDRGELFGELNSVIKRLTEIRNQYKNGETIYLNEEWSGYEDNYFDITVTRLETDEECKARIELEEKEALREKQRLQRAKEAAECKKRREIENKIKELQKQL